MNEINTRNNITVQLRPYTAESTGSRLISKVKLVMAQSVLWWGTTREYWVLKFCLFELNHTQLIQVYSQRCNCTTSTVTQWQLVPVISVFVSSDSSCSCDDEASPSAYPHVLINEYNESHELFLSGLRSIWTHRFLRAVYSSYFCNAAAIDSSSSLASFCKYYVRMMYRVLIMFGHLAVLGTELKHRL
jgi:hypothetical protein